MSIAIISHPGCLLHDAGDLHPERPDRIKVIQKAIEQYPFQADIQYYEAPLVDINLLTSVHDERYINQIFTLAPTKGVVAIDEDTWMNEYTLAAALRAAGSVPFAIDLVMQDKAQVAFCNVRPPGHHAEYDRAMGFCFFNNVAIGAMYAINKYHLNRVLIVDFDVHHGNGIQNIFQNEKRVMYCSSFEHPFYPGYDPELNNDHILNQPLGPGTTGPIFREIVKAAWFDKIEAFKPEFILISAGFDGHAKDLMANLRLEKEDYIWITKQIAGFARTYCHGKIVSVLEGGYSLTALAECVPAHINAMTT